MICYACKGSGNFVFNQQGRFRWWACPCCAGAGVTIQYGPAVIVRVRKLNAK